MLSEAQPLMVKMNYLPATAKIESPLGSVRVKYLDSAAVLDERESCQRMWEDVVENRAGQMNR